MDPVWLSTNPGCHSGKLQQPDGSVTVPEVLVPYMQGVTALRPFDKVPQVVR